MNHPRVSIIIPSYQAEKFIGQALTSSLEQADCSSEIIVIDDGSTDDTRFIVADLEHQSRQTPIRYVYQNNQGVCIARNRGMQLACGEFLVFLDADDFFLPNKLNAQLAVFDSNPDMGIVQTGWKLVNEQGEDIKDITPWDVAPNLDLASWLRFKPVLPSAMMIRRHWIEHIGGFNPALQVAEDVELVLRLSLAGCQSCWLKEVTVAYRQHTDNTMKDSGAQFRDVPLVLDQFFAMHNLPASILLIEPEIRYSTFVWLACFLYFTANFEKMYLAFHTSWRWSPYLPSETIMNWMESLAAYAKQTDQIFDRDELTQLAQWQTLVQSVFEA